MKTMYKGLVNSPETTITNNIGTNDTIIYVLDPARVPSDLPNLMVLGTGTNAETIKVTAIEDNALTVERGFQGIAKDWLAGTIITRNFTEYDYAALVDNINELELTKETPDGAQAKADTAEGNAKTYASDLIGVLSNLKTTVKDKIVSAINELFDNLASHSADGAIHFTKASLTKSDVGLSNVDNVKQMPISGGVLENYREKLVTLSGTSTTINLSLGNVFTHTLSGNTTYSITNAVSGQAHSFTLIINMGSTVRTLTFPASVKWQGGEIPDMSTASKTYVLTFLTINGGTTWLGMFGGEF